MKQIGFATHYPYCGYKFRPRGDSNSSLTSGFLKRQQLQFLQSRSYTNTLQIYKFKMKYYPLLKDLLRGNEKILRYQRACA